MYKNNNQKSMQMTNDDNKHVLLMSQDFINAKYLILKRIL